MSRRTLLIIFSALLLVSVATIWLTSRSKVEAAVCNNEPSLVVNGYAFHWDKGTSSQPHVVSIYIDPTFTSGEQIETAQAVQSWFGTQPMSTNFITTSFVTSDPGDGTPNAIRILNNPAGSPDNLAFTKVATNLTGSIAGATVNFNRSETFESASGTSKLAYDPTAANATNFFTGNMTHELGHAVGLDEAIGSDGQPETPCAATSGSVMGTACGTNNEGDGSSPPDPTNVTPTGCDRGTVLSNIVEPTRNGSGSSGGGGGGAQGGSGDDGSGSYICDTYDEWDDGTNTVTNYTTCSYAP